MQALLEMKGNWTHELQIVGYVPWYRCVHFYIKDSNSLPGVNPLQCAPVSVSCSWILSGGRWCVVTGLCHSLSHPDSSVWCQASRATTLCVCQWLLHINPVPVTLASAAKLQITWRGSRGRDREGERGGLFDYMWKKMCMRMEREKEREIRNVSPRASEQRGRRNK